MVKGRGQGHPVRMTHLFRVCGVVMSDVLRSYFSMGCAGGSRFFDASGGTFLQDASNGWSRRWTIRVPRRRGPGAGGQGPGAGGQGAEAGGRGQGARGQGPGAGGGGGGRGGGGGGGGAGGGGAGGGGRGAGGGGRGAGGRGPGAGGSI